MPKPDCVFIGGSGGRLHQIVDMIHSKGSSIRFVINAVSLETMEEVRKLSDRYEVSEEEAVMIQVNDIKHIGSHHMMKSQNPVWVFSFVI